MWQRIQTLYLIGAILLQWSCLFVPIGKLQGAAGKHISIYGDVAGIEALLLSAIITIGAVTAILKFKNRKSQMKICSFIIIAAIVSLITTIVQLVLFAQASTATPQIYYWMAILPILVITMVALAKRAIHKDDELVRSSNRLR